MKLNVSGLTRKGLIFLGLVLHMMAFMSHWLCMGTVPSSPQLAKSHWHFYVDAIMESQISEVFSISFMRTGNLHIPWGVDSEPGVPKDRGIDVGPLHKRTSNKRQDI